MLKLHIPLNTETESQLRAEALASGVDVATFVIQAVQEKLAATSDLAGASGANSPDDWLRQFGAWADDHPQSPQLNTARESIYSDGD